MASHVVQLASKASEASVTGLPSLLDAVKGRTCGDWLPALPSSWQQAIYQSGERYSFSDIIRAYVPCMPGVLMSPAHGAGQRACGERLERLFPGSVLAEYARTVDADSHRWRYVRKYSVPLLAAIIARRNRQAANSTPESDVFAEPQGRQRRVSSPMLAPAARGAASYASYSSYAAIHLRLGDVLEKSSTSVLEFLQETLTLTLTLTPTLTPTLSLSLSLSLSLTLTLPCEQQACTYP